MRRRVSIDDRKTRCDCDEVNATSRAIDYGASRVIMCARARCRAQNQDVTRIFVRDVWRDLATFQAVSRCQKFISRLM